MRPPHPASDVEKTLTGLEAKLAADQIELGLLRRIERISRRAEIGARVNHSLIEPQLIEVVADIVVVMDRGRIAHGSVARTELPRLLGKPDGSEVIVRLSGKCEKHSHQPRDRERRTKAVTDRP